jgi:predicted RNA binding protein YcfA (HicA-like mRNA interferase family)
MHAGETLYPKTLLSILEQAGITQDEFRKLL